MLGIMLGSRDWPMLPFMHTCSHAHMRGLAHSAVVTVMLPIIRMAVC